MGCTHDEDDTQTANDLIANLLDESVYAEEVGPLFCLDRKLPCGRRTPDGDTRPHPAAMAEMQQLLNRLIAKHTRSLADWRSATAEGHEVQPAYGDIQAATRERAAPRLAHWAAEYVAYVVLKGGKA